MTESVPLPVGPTVMWQSAMITSFDMLMIEFTSDRASWTIIWRDKHSSIARMFVREKPQSVVHDHRDRPVERLHARGHQSVSSSHRDSTSDMFITSTARDGLVETAHASAKKKALDGKGI